MVTDAIVYVSGVIAFVVNILVLFICTRILHDIGDVLKECAKCEIKKYLIEERRDYMQDDVDNIATELEDTESLSKQSLYRNKDGKLSYRVYNDNVKLRQSAMSHKIDLEEEFEHKPVGAGKG